MTDEEELEEDIETVTITISPTEMLKKAFFSLQSMEEWAEETKNGDLMGNVAAGYLEIHDRLVELVEDEEHKKQGFGFKSHLGEKEDG